MARFVCMLCYLACLQTTIERMNGDNRVPVLISLTPIIQSPEHNVIRIERQHDVITENVQYIAGGPNKGIIINKPGSYKPIDADIPLSFSVWLKDEDLRRRQEIRLLRLVYYQEVSYSVKHEVAQSLFRDIVARDFPKDYVTFFKRVLKLMQNDYWELRLVEIDMKFAQEDEAMQMPDAKAYDATSEIEDVTAGHVKDVLEHAYPNGLTVDIIAESLRAPIEQVEEFLEELAAQSIVQRVENQENEWIRVVPISLNHLANAQSNKQHPTVAIITCLFVEKQTVDSIIQGSTTVHKYRSGGDSNVYTIGEIGNHRVVATKLAIIGDSREATTSAGSITTRLLGNFQHVEHVIIVGIGGGVAHYTDAESHVRLGDVVMSYSGPKNKAYIYAHNYLFNRKTEQIDGFAIREWFPKDQILAEIVKNGDDNFMAEWQNTANDLINRENGTSDLNFSRPPPETDILALPVGGGNVVVVPHPNQERITSTVHLGPVGAMSSIARTPPPETGDAPNGVTHLKKAPVQAKIQPSPTKTHDSETDVQYSNLILQLRDKFAAENNVKAFDAGFDSVIAAIHGSRIDSWVLIRGIADYQQGSSRSGRQWQPHAAANAAALIKTILKRLPKS
uniref:Nucleoside phosphorylase domain-containing protein n=1 Tax=Acrobeloides nanus TaxID=290746 RepID=A0A914CK19_9BILA